MHVAFLNQYYAPFTASTSHLLTDVATHLAASGHRVTVITGRSAYLPEERSLAAPKRERVGGVEVIRVGSVFADRSSKMRRILGYGWYLAGAMAAVLRLDRPDVVVSLTTPPFLVAAAILPVRLKRSRLMLWLMDMYPDALAADGMLDARGLAYKVLAAISRASYRASSRIIVLDDYMRARLADGGVDPRRLVVSSNWEPFSKLESTDGQRRTFRESTGIRSSDFVLLYLGNLGRAHEVATLVDAMEQLRSRDDIKLVFVGGGTRIAELREQVSSRGLTNIILRPGVPKSEIPLPLSGADAGIVTMLGGWNGILSPSKVHSLLAAGLPVLYIGPERSAVADIVREAGAGAVHPAGDVAGVVQTIAGWSTDRKSARAAGERSRSMFEQSFTREKGVSRVADAILYA